MSAAALAAPLLGAPSLPTVGESEEEKEEKENANALKGTIGLAALAGGGVLMAIWMVATLSLTIVYVACVFPIVLAPVIVARRREILSLPSIRQNINKIRENANSLTEANDHLHGENNRLGVQVDALAGVEESLHKVANLAGGSGPKLRELVIENGRLRREIEKTSEKMEDQGLYSSICQSDRDHDFTISGREVDLMLMRFQNVIQASKQRRKHISRNKKDDADERPFDENAFRQLFAHGRDVPFMEVYETAQKCLRQLNDGERKRRRMVAEQEKEQAKEQVKVVSVEDRRSKRKKGKAKIKSGENMIV